MNPLTRIVDTLDAHPIVTAAIAGAWFGGWSAFGTVLLAAIVLPVALACCLSAMRKS